MCILNLSLDGKSIVKARLKLKKPALIASGGAAAPLGSMPDRSGWVQISVTLRFGITCVIDYLYPRAGTKKRCTGSD